jgi:hypothetical protein
VEWYCVLQFFQCLLNTYNLSPPSPSLPPYELCNCRILTFMFLCKCVSCTCRFGKVLFGLQLTFEQQCDGTTSLTSVKTTRKLVSVALEVNIKFKIYSHTHTNKLEQNDKKLMIHYKHTFFKKDFILSY